ncbi:MAG: M15 family metallopeptidase [Pseudoflavonifractor sp.]|nr:M15 family metallopeptidase [Pseudoflavonifractor sp.]
MSFPLDFLTPIPPSPAENWDRVQPLAESGELLVDPTTLSPHILYGAAYVCQGLPGALDHCLVRQGLALRLVQAAEKLPEGWSLLIFDGLRPLRLQQALYDQFREIVTRERPQASPAEVEMVLETFVAKPVKRRNRPAPHTTGGAVDLTLYRNGATLDMGTGFDDLTSMAHTDWLEHSCPPGQEECRNARRMLYNLMTSVGLVNYPCEWWHYAYGERQWAVRTGKAPFYGYCEECDG